MASVRVIEIAAWSAGALLLATYGGMRTWSEYASNQGLMTMRQARAQYAAATRTAGARTEAIAAAAATNGSAPRGSLSAAQPDTSNWAPRRQEEYRNSTVHGVVPGAVLRVPKLRLEVPVYEGTSDAVLNRGAGHIAATAAIDSETGNIGIAAHRDGFFRSLKDIQVGEAIFIDTISTTRRYRVTRLDIVEPDNVGVLDHTPAPTITLVTCYPFYHVGAAPQRFIVFAQLD